MGITWGLGPGAHSKVTTKDSIKRMVKLKNRGFLYSRSMRRHVDTIIDSPEAYDLDLAMNLLRIKGGVSFEEIEKSNIYIPDSFLQKRLKGIEDELLEADGFRATQIGYKFLNDTINLFN